MARLGESGWRQRLLRQVKRQRGRRLKHSQARREWKRALRSGRLRPRRYAATDSVADAGTSGS